MITISGILNVVVLVIVLVIVIMIFKALFDLMATEFPVMAKFRPVLLLVFGLIAMLALLHAFGFYSPNFVMVR